MAGKNNSAQGASRKGGKSILTTNNSRTFKNMSAYAGVANTSSLTKYELEAAATVGSLNKKVVAGKSLADFAPVAKIAVVEKENGATAAVAATSTSSAAAATNTTITDVNVFQVMQAARLCENTVDRDMRRVVSTIANTPFGPSRIVRRIVCKGKRDRQNGIILGTCELAAKVTEDAAAPAILIVEPTDGDAKRLVDLYKTMGVPAALIVDTSDEDDESAATSKKTKASQNPALSSLAAPIVVDPRVLKKNKFLQLAAANRKAPTTSSYTGLDTSAAQEVTFALTKAPKVGVTSLSSIFTCVNDQHARQYSIVVIDEPQPRDEELYATLAMMLTKIRNVYVVASTAELGLNPCTAPLCGKPANAAAAADEDDEATGASSSGANKDLPISFVTTEGLPRLQTLLALLQNSGRTNKIVVQCATIDCAIFLCDLLFALNSPEEGNFRLFCDSENRDDKAQLAIDVATISDRFDRVDVKKEGKGAVLLTAHGLLPKTGTLLVQYDPIVSMTQFVVGVIAPAAANVAAYQNYQAEVVAMAAANNEKTVPVPFTSPANANGYAYRHIIVFFYPTEEAGALTLIADTLRRLNTGSASWELRPEQIKPVSINTAAASLLTIQSVKELHKKVFAIQNNAYNAYRSLMQVYSRLHPKSIYNVDALNLEAVAAQFGYEELPLLDLRTKNTPFRPKLDVFRVAAIKSKHTMKRVRAEAEANVVGEGPDEEWMKDAAPFKSKDPRYQD